MPFDLDEYESAFGHFFYELTIEMARSKSPLLSVMPPIERRETVASVVDRSGEPPVNVDETPIEMAMTMDVVAVADGRLESFSELAEEAAQQTADGLVEALLRTVNDVTEATGNVIRSPDGFTFESLYQALDGLEWSLDDNDELVAPTIVLHPDTFAKIPPPTAEQNARMDELRNRKHRELLARRRSRRLS